MTLRLDEVLPDRSLRFVPEWLGAAPREAAARVVTVSRALYDEIDSRYDEILARHPGLAKGAHVSLLRLVDWPVPE